MPRTVFDLSFLSATPFYYIFLAVLAVLLGLTWWIERGRMGFYLRAIKDSERAARSLGVSAGRYKLYAYMLSGAFTSLAGSLYLCMFGFVDPESGFGILISVKMVVMAALGGAGQLFGPLVGALILVPLEELSNSLSRRPRRRPHLRGLRRHHRDHRPLPAERPAVAVRAPPGASRPQSRPRAAMLIEARNVIKAFGAFKAVDDASVSVEEGDILGLIGPNGAGKSTFFNCLTGDLPVTSGTRVLRRHRRHAPAARGAGAGSVSPAPSRCRSPSKSMSVLDNATIGALLRHPNAREARAKARDVLQRVGLGRLADTPAKSLGTPGRKRLEIARALASEPKALLLDEAMAGLTPTEVREAIELVRRIHGGGITIVIVEHIMEVIVSLAQPRRGVPPGPRDRPRHAARGHQQPAVIEAYLGRRKVRHGGHERRRCSRSSISRSATAT